MSELRKLRRSIARHRGDWPSRPRTVRMDKSDSKVVRLPSHGPGVAPVARPRRGMGMLAALAALAGGLLPRRRQV
jgi:hypothetical protein